MGTAWFATLPLQQARSATVRVADGSALTASRNSCLRQRTDGWRGPVLSGNGGEPCRARIGRFELADDRIGVPGLCRPGRPVAQFAKVLRRCSVDLAVRPIADSCAARSSPPSRSSTTTSPSFGGSEVLGVSTLLPSPCYPEMSPSPFVLELVASNSPMTESAARVRADRADRCDQLMNSTR